MGSIIGNVRGANRVTMDATGFVVKSNSISKNFNSKFSLGDYSLFTLTNSGVTVTQKPLSFNFSQFITGSYLLTSNYTLNATESAGFFNINFGFRFKNNPTLVAAWKPFIFNIDGGSEQIKLTFIYDPLSGDTSLEVYTIDSSYSPGGTTSVVNLGSMKNFNLKLTYFYDALNVLIFKTPNELELLHYTEIYLSSPCSLKISGEAGSTDGPGQVTVKDVSFMPVFDYEQTMSGVGGMTPIVGDLRNDSYNVFTNFTMPGNFNLALNQPWPAYSTAQTPEILELEVLPSRAKRGAETFLISDLEKFYTDAAPLLACPARGLQGQANKGNLQIYNQCFNDGSSRDDSPMELIFTKFGKFNVLGDRTKNPEFVIKDDDKEYGSNFDFQRLYHYKSGLVVDSNLNHNITCLKSLKLSSGNILYYGFVGYTCYDKDISINLIFNWSSEQIANPGLVIDEFDWSLEYEDGTVIDSNTALHYSDYLTKLPASSYNIQPSRVRLIIYHNFSSLLGSGSIEAEVLDDGSLIATGMAEYNSLGQSYETDFRISTGRGVCVINFEISTSYGYIISYVHDLCNDSITKYQDSGNYANIAKDNISAIETPEGDIAYIFIERDPFETYYDDRRKNLSYKKMNLATGISGTYSSINDIILPNSMMVNNYINCFDIVQKENSMNIYLSLVTTDKYVQETKNRDGVISVSKRNVPFTPFGTRGLICLGINIRGWDFNNKDYTIIDYKSSNVVFTGLEEFCRVGQADIFFFDGSPEDGQFWRKYANVASISAVYDKDSDRTVISCLETNTRLPVVLMGNDLSFKEIAIPPFFNIFEKTKGRGMPSKSYDYSFYTNFGIDSFSSTIFSDGMVYSLVSKRDIRELGLIDPSFYWSAQQELAEVQTGSQYRAKVFQPEFRFENYPFMSTGFRKEPYENFPSHLVYPTSVHINNINSRMFVCISSKNLSKMPTILANSIYDVTPFETFNQLVWFPELTSYQENFNNTSATYVKDEYCEVRNKQSSLSMLQGTLTASNTLRNEHWKLHLGYKFHARIKCLPNSLVFTEPLYFYGSGITNIEAPFIKCEARFRIMASYAQAQYYDYASLSWKQVGDDIPLSGGTYDYYILMQKNGDDASNKGSVAFIVKEFEHQKVLSSSSETIYNLRNETLFYGSVFNISLYDAETIEETAFGVFFFQNNLADRNEYARIYEMGFNLLKADIGNYIPFTNTKPSATTYTDYRDEPRIGRRWRNFDDTILFNYNNKPNYKFKTFINSGSSITSRYHWYNGFSFALTGESCFNLDKISLQREVLSDVNSILSRNLYGQFNTKDTTQNVTIWADAFDSGFEKFMVDLVVLAGINFDRFTIVGKNDIGDLWTVIKQCDSYKYSGSFVVKSEGSKVKFTNEEYNIPFGTLLNYDHYTYNSSYGVCKINDTSGSSIIAQTFNGFPYNSVYKIFTSRVAVKLDEVESYRFIGIRTNSTNTYDGFFKISSLDFGKSTQAAPSFTVDLGFNSIKNINSDLVTVYNNQSLNLESGLDYNNYQLTYSVTSAKTYLTLLSIADKLANNSRPIWFIPDIDNDRFDFDLTFVDGRIDHQTLVDEVVGKDIVKKFYKITINLKGVPK